MLYLAIGIAFLLAIAGAGYKGYNMGEDHAAAQAAIAQEKADKDARDNAIIDMSAAAENARREALIQARSTTVQGKANDAIRTAPLAANCNWSQPTYVLLADAVAASNGADPNAADELSRRVRAANTPGVK